MQAPNSVAPHLLQGLDLRKELTDFTVPSIYKIHYWSIQLIDLYTHNCAYLGSRPAGSGGGKSLIDVPNLRSRPSQCIIKVLPSENEFPQASNRTQPFIAADLNLIEAIQVQSDVWPFLGYFGLPASPAHSILASSCRLLLRSRHVL